MAEIRYFVSLQNGSDLNDGLTKETAWATLTKANQAVGTPAVGNQHKIIWGPGTYREKLVMANAGRSEEECIHWIPDPDCRYLTDDKPGICRITGCDVDEIPTSGDVLANGVREYTVFGDYGGACGVDGSTGNAVTCSWPNYQSKRINIHAQSAQYAFMNCSHTINCTGSSGEFAFQSCAPVVNCVGAGGSGGFGGRCVAIHCATIAGSSGFKYNASFNCLASCTSTGFLTMAAFHCAAHNIRNGYTNIAVHNCYVAGYASSATTSSIAGDGSVTNGSLSLARIGQIPYMIAGVKGMGSVEIMPDTCLIMPAGNSTQLFLTTEQVIAFTPTATGTNKGVAINVVIKTSSGNIACELQKNIGGSWQTQRSKTISVTAYAAGWWLFLWDTGDGDDNTTPVPDTWRYRITADASAANSMLDAQYDPMVPLYIGLHEPDDYPYLFDIDGRPRATEGGGNPAIGAWEPPHMETDWDVYYETAPAIRLYGHSMQLMQVPAKAGEEIAVSWWVRHHGTDSDRKPQIWLRHKGSHTPLVTATCTAAADTWEELSVSATPDTNTVLEVCLFSRDIDEDSYSVFSDPTVS